VQQTKKYKYGIGSIMMVSAKKNMGMDKLRAEVKRFMRKLEENSASSTKQETGQTTKTSETTKTEQPVKETPTLKDQWRKDEERKQKMMEKKWQEQEEERENPPLERDEKGKVFKPTQRYKKKKK
jgi:hypothetical protein